MLIIRAAVADDLRAVAGMHVRSWRYGFHYFIDAGQLPDTDVADRRAFWTAHFTRPTGLTLVAESPTGISGACAIEIPSTTVESSDSCEAEIAALYVDPASWRTGAGRSLLAAARPLVRAHGHRRWALWTLSTHASTRAFYAREGFIAHEHRQHDWGAPLVRLSADLDPSPTEPS